MGRKPDAGETLVEVLAAILIFTFGSIVLLTMFSAAKRINLSAREAEEARSAQLTAMELGLNEEQPGEVTITLGEVTETVEAVFTGAPVFFSKGGAP